MTQLTDPQLFARTIADQFIHEHNLPAEYQARLPSTPPRQDAEFFTRDNAFIEAQAAIWLAAARTVIEAAGLKWKPRYERVERTDHEQPNLV